MFSWKSGNQKMHSSNLNSEEIQKAYQQWDQVATISNFKVACYLGLVLMPAGVMLDHFVYHKQAPEFLELRLLSDVFIAAFLILLRTQIAQKHYRAMGVALAMVPSSFMSIMIYKTTGETSPYYAGLNLVLLVFGFIMHWTFRETVIAVTLIFLMYLAACFGNGPIQETETGIFFNNVYFMAL